MRSKGTCKRPCSAERRERVPSRVNEYPDIRISEGIIIRLYFIESSLFFYFCHCHCVTCCGLSACLINEDIYIFIHSAISIAPLQVLYYSEALQTTARILYR